jgi:urea transporter
MLIELSFYQHGCYYNTFICSTGKAVAKTVTCQTYILKTLGLNLAALTNPFVMSLLLLIIYKYRHGNQAMGRYLRVYACKTNPRP